MHDELHNTVKQNMEHKKELTTELKKIKQEKKTFTSLLTNIQFGYRSHNPFVLFKVIVYHVRESYKIKKTKCGKPWQEK